MVNSKMSNEQLVYNYNKSKSESILEEILQKNKPFVIKVARTCMPKERNDLNYDDLIQVGFTALIDAVKGFNTEQSYSKFLSYASNLIIWRIKREIGKVYNQSNGMGINTVHDIFKMNKTKEFLTLQTGKEPSNEELAEKLSIPLTKLELLLKKESNLKSLSLNQSLDKNNDEGDLNLIGLIESNSLENYSDCIDLKLDMQNSIKSLTKNEKKYINLFLKDYDNSQIARQLNVSKRRIYQISKSAFQKLRPQLEDYDTF